MTMGPLRDPRQNPIPGDTLEKARIYRTVYAEGLVEKRGVHKHGVTFCQHSRVCARPGSMQRTISLSQWRKWSSTAQVVRVGDETERAETPVQRETKDGQS